jgi:hypothetical protein
MRDNKKRTADCGPFFLLLAQSNPPIDTEIVKKGRFRMGTGYWIK